LGQPELQTAAALLNLGIADGAPFTADPNLIATGRTCVSGASGSGESYTAAVICEELCKNNVPFALINTEGEYSGLKEKYQAVRLGDDQRCDLRLGEVGMDEVARRAPEVAPLVVDILEVRLHEIPLELDAADKGERRAESARLREGELREVVRGIWDGADLDSFSVFHYPVYGVELMVRLKRRYLWLDGRNAKELEL
jgi:DNA helicase HerA-like ATPase